MGSFHEDLKAVTPPECEHHPGDLLQICTKEEIRDDIVALIRKFNLQWYDGDIKIQENPDHWIDQWWQYDTTAIRRIRNGKCHMITVWHRIGDEAGILMMLGGWPDCPCGRRILWDVGVRGTRSFQSDSCVMKRKLIDSKRSNVVEIRHIGGPFNDEEVITRDFERP